MASNGTDNSVVDESELEKQLKEAVERSAARLKRIMADPASRKQYYIDEMQRKAEASLIAEQLNLPGYIDRNKRYIG